MSKISGARPSILDMSRQSNQAAYDAMKTRLESMRLPPHDVGYVMDMAMTTYKQFVKLSKEKGDPQRVAGQLYDAVRDDLNSRGLERLVDPLIAVVKDYVTAVSPGD
jgi:hypothetical protein